MLERLEAHYERALAFWREQAGRFQGRYPAEAGRLLPDENRVPDPHLDRFLEAFALLTGRIHHKLDCEFPELTEALLSRLAPHLLRPIPSLTIAQFEMDETPSPMGQNVPKGTLLATLPMGPSKLSCRWQTGYPVRLWPVKLTKAIFQKGPFPGAPPRTQAALRLTFECVGDITFRDLEMDHLRLYLSGEKQLLASLYELFFHHAVKVLVRAPNRSATALAWDPADILRPVGLDLDEGVIPFPSESFPGHRLLMEFLTFPAKFLFVDLRGWRRLRKADVGKVVEVNIFVSRFQENLEQGVSPQTFLLGCTPVINAFERSADPLAVTQTKTEYMVVPSREHPVGMEVLSIDSVTGLSELFDSPIEYRPFYEYDLGQTIRDSAAFWHATRRASTTPRDPGTDVYLSLTNSRWNPTLPADEVLDVRTTCCNRDVPIVYQKAGAPLFPVGVAFGGKIRALHAPTPTLRPALRGDVLWRLLGTLGRNQQSLTDPDVGLDALRETLRLCDFTASSTGFLQTSVNRQILEGMAGWTSRRTLGKVVTAKGVGHCRGLEFTLELDEKKFVGIGVYLFASVLERYLGLYAGFNAFSQLVVRTVQGDFEKRWPPRAVQTQLL
jgi:type VI secretion system protein ImpG